MTRAAPMPPEERRASLIEATLPLLLKNGPSLTTKEVAEAAGVAEGTIFRVFESLNHLIDATTSEALSARRLQADIDAAEPGPTLRSKTSMALNLLEHRMSDIRALLATAHHHPRGTGDSCLRDELDARRVELSDWLVATIEIHADELAISPADYVSYLQIVALGHVLSTRDGALDTNAIADLALGGALRKA